MNSWVDLKVFCKECDSMIVVCQSKDKDYHYYCSQKLCKNHDGVETYDDEGYPDFVKEVEWKLPSSMLCVDKNK